jgi:hypothetical protein
MPRCSTHCPPPRSGGRALLLAVTVAAVVTVAGCGTAIAHALTTLAITAAIIAGLTIAGLATAVVVRLRSESRETRPGRRALSSGGGRAAIGRQDDRPSGRDQIPATEQHLHLHVHGANAQELAHLLSRPHTPGGPES